MPLNILFSIFVTHIFLTAAACAQDMKVVSDELDAYAQRKKHTFELSAETYSYKYDETVGGEKFMNTKGSYKGLLGAYTFRPVDMDSFFDEIAANIFSVEVSYAVGQVDYDGAYTDGVTVTPFTYSGIDDYTYEVRGLAGREYLWGQGWGLTPYFGVGLRYLNNGSREMPYGYDRESRYMYMPLGFTLNKQFCGGWALAWNAEYDQLVAGKQTSHFENIDPGLNAIENDQRKGFGARTSLKIQKDLAKVKLSVEPFFRYWHIQPSTIDPITYGGDVIVGAGQEPENTTQEFGVKMGVHF